MRWITWVEYYQRRSEEAAKEYDSLSSSEREMRILLADRDRVRRLAGDILNSHAMAMAGGNRMGYPNQLNPERYREALRHLMQQHPNLAAAYSSGVIDSDDWSLAATLIPSIATEVRNKFGAEPLNLRGSNYSAGSSVRRYSSDDSHVQYDAQGRQFRVY